MMTIEALKQIPLMQCFHDDELAELLKLGDHVDCPVHTNVIIEGELSWGLYLILDGELEVTRIPQVGQAAYRITKLQAGSFFGELSLIDQNPRSATVRAIADSKLFCIDKVKFDLFIKKNQDRKIRFLDHAIVFIVSRLRQVDEHFIVSQYQLWSEAFKSKRERVAS